MKKLLIAMLLMFVPLFAFGAGIPSARDAYGYSDIIAQPIKVTSVYPAPAMIAMTLDKARTCQSLETIATVYAMIPNGDGHASLSATDNVPASAKGVHSIRAAHGVTPIMS